MNQPQIPIDKNNKNLIITDTKGELAELFSKIAEANGYEMKIFNVNGK